MAASWVGLVEVKKISFDFEPHFMPGSQEPTSWGPVLVLGAHIRNRVPRYSYYRWVQSIKTNRTCDRSPSAPEPPVAGTWYNDPYPPDDDMPFYWTNLQYPNHTNISINGEHYDLVFNDHPGLGLFALQEEDPSYIYEFDAILQLVGVSSMDSKSYSVIKEFHWGFKQRWNATIVEKYFRETK